MSESENLSVQSIENLKISPLYEEIFRHFKIPRNALYEKIKHEGYNPYSTLKIRRVPKKRDYEILCGVGRQETMLRLARESRYSNKSILEVRCRKVEQEDDENCIALILSENIDTKRFFKRFSPLQFYLLFKLLKNFSNVYLPKDYVKYEFDFKESIYQQLNTSYDFIIKNIKSKYPQFFEELRTQFAGNPLTEKLQDLKLINHAIEQNEWLDLVNFFDNKIKISVFYGKYCKESSSKQQSAKKPPEIQTHQKSSPPTLTENAAESPINELQVTETETPVPAQPEPLPQKKRKGKKGEDNLSLPLLDQL